MRKSKMLTVLVFEYKNFVKSASFIVMTVIFVLAGLIGPSIPTIGSIAGGGLLEALLGGDGDAVALVDAAGILADDDLPFAVTRYDSLDDAQAALSTGDVTCAAEIKDYNFTMYVPSMKISVYSTQSQLENALLLAYRKAALSALGIDGARVDDILAFTPQSELVAVEAGGGAADYQENMVYAYVMLFIVYFGLIMCGSYVLTTVVREKSTKTMELLVTSCKPGQLIHGKVLGVGLAALTQQGLLAGAAVLSMAVNGLVLMNMADVAAIADVAAVSIRLDIIAFMALFYLLGMFAYAYLYAGLASTVSRMEDASSVSALPVMLVILSFFAAIAGLMSPAAGWLTALSYVPFFTPMVMFTRICLGTAAGWEIALGIALQLATIVATGWLGGRIYRLGTLMYGNKLNFRDIAAVLRE